MVWDTRVFDNQLHTTVNQIIRMPSAYNRNSQSLQFGSFGTLISLFFIIYCDLRSGAIQHFGDLYAAFGQSEHNDLLSAI
ncbi:hypothetical protein D3C76_1765830 [compost metagenome]